MTTATGPEAPPEVLRFGGFELRLDSLELRRQGDPVPLQQQPARVLALLAGRAGATIPRQEIRDAIWGEETFVDSEQGINYCVRQIRIALDDDAESPRFVETVPKVGYRFVAPVDAVPGEEVAPRPVRPVGPARSAPRWRSGPIAVVLLVILAIGAVAGTVAVLRSRRSSDAGPPVAVRTAVIPEEAHFRYLEARHLLDRADSAHPVADAERAIELLQAALEEAPDYAPAHAALGDAWLYRYDVPRSEALANAERSAQRALDLDPEMAQAHALDATTRLFLHFDWDGAAEHVGRALELDPRNVDALFLKAVLSSARGRHDEGIAAARHALELAPGHLPDISLGWFYFFARRYDQAIEEAERILELVPTDEPSHRVLLLAAFEMGDEERADREFRRFWRTRLVEVVEARTGEPPAEEWLDDQLEDSPGAREVFRIGWQSFDNQRSLEGQGMSPTIPAEYAVLAGEAAPAIHYLLRACQEQTGSWDLVFVAEDPRWDPLRGQPGFDEVLRCVGVDDRSGLIPRLRELFE